MVWYRRERHWRVGIFCTGAALAGAFGGISDSLPSHVQESIFNRYLILLHREDGRRRRQKRMAMVSALLPPPSHLGELLLGFLSLRDY
jgi:hypothetical protein